METINRKKEIVWVDWVKFICVVFVYWCHVGQLGTNTSPIPIPYGPLFVNAFFFVSGYLIFRKQLGATEVSLDYKAFWKKNVRGNGMLPNIFWKIAVPSALFSMIDYIPRQLVGGGTISLSDFLINTLVRGTNWFTCSLFVAELVLFVLLCTRLKSVWPYFIAGIIVALFGRYLQLQDVELLGDPYLPWFYKSGLVSVLFLVSGGVYSHYEDQIDGWMSKRTRLLVTIFLTVAYLILYYSFSRSIKFSALTGLNVEGFFMSLLAIVTIIYLCKYFKAHMLVKYVSRHSIGFYFLSASIPYVSCMVVEQSFPLGSIAFLVEFAISFTGAVLAVYLLNRFIPWIFDFRKIARQ